ncbi:unnamed protein product, partial [Rotaria magnacalcarata]
MYHIVDRNSNWRYPTRAQYAIIVVGILNHLGVERDSKNVDSWRESLISKYKRER